jgi:hypothetical protein
MSTQMQARTLMMRHHQIVKNREQAMLTRAIAELGLEIDVTHYHTHIQGKTPAGFQASYDRSQATMS